MQNVSGLISTFSSASRDDQTTQPCGTVCTAPCRRRLDERLHMGVKLISSPKTKQCSLTAQYALRLTAADLSNVSTWASG
jgi:hypothetical protein